MNDFDEEMYNVDEFADDVNQNHEETSQETNSQNEEDLTNDLLALRGIKDLDKIKFEDESGAIVERSWDSLDRAEKLNILAGEPEQTHDDSQDLDDDEINLNDTDKIIINTAMKYGDVSIYIPYECLQKHLYTISHKQLIR